MKEKLTDLLGNISQTLQAAQLEWILLTILVVVVLILIFAFDKPKTVLWLLVLYTALFVLLQIPGAIDWLTKNAPHYARYAGLIVGAIPVVVIGVIKFKRKK